MVDRFLRPWPVRMFLNKISKWVILITLALSIIVVGISIYAENVGNFIITIDSSNRSALAFLTEYDPTTGGYKEVTYTLFAPPVENMIDCSYDTIPNLYSHDGQTEDLLAHEGEHSDKDYKDQGTQYTRYYAYSFYLTNLADIPIDYGMFIEVNASTKGSDPHNRDTPKMIEDALRIMIIKSEYKDGLWRVVDDDGMDTNTNGALTPQAEQAMKNDLHGKRIYAKTDTDGNAPQHLDYIQGYQEKPYVTQRFYGSRTLVSQNTSQFPTAAVYKYTIVMWLEGNDPECTDGMQNASIRMSCSFAQTGGA